VIVYSRPSPEKEEVPSIVQSFEIVIPAGGLGEIEQEFTVPDKVGVIAKLSPTKRE
jgi:hypothetical protein